jgi:hypothetical protein
VLPRSGLAEDELGTELVRAGDVLHRTASDFFWIDFIMSGWLHPCRAGSGVWGRSMPDTDDKVGLTVKITVKLRPDEYDELFRHVCQRGSTMSAFLRESAARAIKEEQAVALDRALSPAISIAPD